MKKIKFIFLSLIMAIGLMGLTGTKAFALETVNDKAAKTYQPYMSVDSTILLNNACFPGSSIGGFPTDNYKITKVTSSNKKALVYAKDISSDKDFFLETVGAGRSKITVTVTYKKKTYKLSKVVEVVKEKPFKSIKYDKKEIYKGNEFTNAVVKNAKTGKKLEWKLNKGYKVISATFIGKTNKNVKLGDKLNLKGAEYPQVYFFIKTPKDKYIYYNVDFMK